jgi:hypothetical protein
MEFKDIITNNLENSGLLNMIRAELRSEIFEQIKKDGFGTEESKRVTDQDLPCIALIKDFLEKSDAENTLKTFLSEVTGEVKIGPADQALKGLQVNREASGPFIFEIIKKFNEKRNV